MYMGYRFTSSRKPTQIHMYIGYGEMLGQRHDHHMLPFGSHDAAYLCDVCKQFNKCVANSI